MKNRANTKEERGKTLAFEISDVCVWIFGNVFVPQTNQIEVV